MYKIYLNPMPYPPVEIQPINSISGMAPDRMFNDYL